LDSVSNKSKSSDIGMAILSVTYCFGLLISVKKLS